MANVFNETLKKISLTQDQKDKVMKHFKNVENILHSVGFNQVDIQGSFGRDTVIQGTERFGTGFDIDTVAIATTFDARELSKKNNEIFEALRNSKEYGDHKDWIIMEPKAINVKIDDEFSFDVTIIAKDSNDKEVEKVFNSQVDQLQESGGLLFRDQYNELNKKSTKNSQRDLSKIYKHIKDSTAKDILVPSIVLDILISKNQPDEKSDYTKEMLTTLDNIDKELWLAKKEKSYSKIDNPVDSKDHIDTKMYTVKDLYNLIILNSIVKDFIESELVNSELYTDIANKFYEKAHDFYENVERTPDERWRN